MLLESDSPIDEAKPFRMARDVYKSCMDKEQIEIMGVRPLKEILKQFGGWPVLEGDAWNDEGYIWYEQVSRQYPGTLFLSIQLCGSVVKK